MLKLPEDDNNKVRADLLLAWLADQGCNEVMIEAGATLSGAFIGAELVDQLVVYIAPKILGNKARGLVSLEGVEKLSHAKHFKLLQSRNVGTDICLTYGKE